VSANAGVEHSSNNYGLTANAAVQRSQTGNVYQISAKTSGQTGGLYWTSRTNSHTSEILNKTTQINQINPLRLDPNLQELRDYIGNRTLLNVESGGVLATTNNNTKPPAHRNGNQTQKRKTTHEMAFRRPRGTQHHRLRRHDYAPPQQRQIPRYRARRRRPPG